MTLDKELTKDSTEKARALARPAVWALNMSAVGALIASSMSWALDGYGVAIVLAWCGVRWGLSLDEAIIGLRHRLNAVQDSLYDEQQCRREREGA